MKTEQEIVLQKKMIIILSLMILAVVIGVLNIEKQKLYAADNSIDEKDLLYTDSVIKVHTVYTANEEFFTIKESGENVEQEEKEKVAEDVEQEDKKIIAENKVQEDEIVVIESNLKNTNEDTNTENVASRGSYVRDTSTPPTEYERVLKVKATAYCLCMKCCGKSPDNPRYGYTASGIRIVPGTGMKVIAVDTSVVPLGTNVYVEGLNGAGNYGYAIAADTGSAIKNNKIDLYMDTHGEALSWGVKYVNLYILGD